MIQETLLKTKNATFAVLAPHPDPAMMGFPTPNGTGFFVSKEGLFLSARHVFMKEDSSNKPVPYDLSKIILTKPELFPSPQIHGVTVRKDWPEYDLVLLKVDFDKFRQQDAFKGKDGFDFIDVDFSVTPEGKEVYSFGYPLPDFRVQGNQQMMMGVHYFCPRTTSAIISSHIDVIGPIFSSKGYPTHYVIDKALNYGNSGGPLVVQETGRAISVCVRFQPVNVPQRSGGVVLIPSLYGITSSLKNIEAELKPLLGT